jgi:hypothetical protein
MAASTRKPLRRAALVAAPFGHPDGASGDLREVQSNFVDFSDLGAVGGLASRPDDRTVRVLVGKKGVGKTIYLRRYQASASDESSLFAADREAEPPATEDVVRVTQLFDAATVTETWALIWRRAIQRAVVSQLLCRPMLRDRLEPEIIERLGDDYRALIPECRTPRPVYSEVGDILANGHTAHKLNDYLKSRYWAEVDHWLGRALREAPPIYMFIDAVDDHFQRAPMYWLKCQKGLLLQVMAMLQGEIGNRLHVVVGIRDLVLSSVLRGEHASRYRRSPHVRVLEWDYESIRYFLEAKSRRLDRTLLLSPRQGGIAQWLGTEEIYNRARGVTEQVDDYLLRHTRMIPRDVVVLGNALCEYTAQPAAHRAGRLTDEVLRRVVGQVARGLADEQIRVCANQIAADKIPARGGRHGLTDYFVGSHEYSDGAAGQLTELLTEVGRDRFDYDTVQRLADRGRAKLDGYEHLVDVLWHNGVLGYDSPEEGADYAHFHAATEADDFHLPSDKTSYVLHPCVGHLVRTQHIGRVPVRGFRKA